MNIHAQILLTIMILVVITLLNSIYWSRVLRVSKLLDRLFIIEVMFGGLVALSWVWSS